MAGIYVPPNGFVGYANQTPAAKGNQTLRGVGITSGTRSAFTRKRRKKSTKARSTKRASTRRSKPARLVKGSAAAKAYMAKIRKRRKK